MMDREAHPPQKNCGCFILSSSCLRVVPLLIAFLSLNLYREVSQAEQEQFFKMISHAQGGRMEGQRCSLQPSRSTPATPKHNGGALNNVPTGQKTNTGGQDQVCVFYLRDVMEITL